MTGGAEIIKELKAAVLAIEWEINDEAIENLIRVIGSLNKQWVGRKPLLVCLQVIGTLGQYIKKARERAHPDAVQLLPAVFATLETIVTDETIDEKQMVIMVRAEVEKYNRLKGELARPRPVEAEKTQPVVEEKSAEGQGGSTIRNLLDQKEDKQVDGAFNVLFQEMVSDEGAKPPPPVAAARAGMPSSSHQQVDGDKEFVPDRVDDEVFQEADELLDDFFSDDGLGFTVVDDEAETAVQVEDEVVEVDVGQISPAEKEEKIDSRPDAAADEEEVDLTGLEGMIQQVKVDAQSSLFHDIAVEAAQLTGRYLDHSSLHFFLQSIASVARHLEEHGDVVREASCKILREMYDRLSHSLFTMQPQKSLLASHLETLTDYIAWHEQVVGEILSRAAQPQVQPEPVVEAGEAEYEMPVGMESAVKELVRREVDALRSELLEIVEKK